MGEINGINNSKQTSLGTYKWISIWNKSLKYLEKYLIYIEESRERRNQNAS